MTTSASTGQLSETLTDHVSEYWPALGDNDHVTYYSPALRDNSV